MIIFAVCCKYNHKYMEINRVYDIFKQLNAIPRASHHEKNVADFLCRYAESLNLDYDRDNENCVVIRKPATKGYEGTETIVLLNHMDMVAVCDGSRPFNYLTDGIDSYIENGWMKAYGTSLGADNGIGLSMALAILADDTIVHPALEVLTTTNEEDGMSGAIYLSENFIKGRKVINLDSEDYDTITVGAAGAYIQSAAIPIKMINTPSGLTFFKVTISGGVGGHSGVDINKGRMNAIREMCCLLFNYQNIIQNKNIQKRSLYLSSIDGGNASASIPSACIAVVGVLNTDVETFQLQVHKDFENINKKYDAERNLKLIVEKIEQQNYVFENEDIIMIVRNLPCGVIRLHDNIPDTVMTSNNIGTIHTENDSIIISCHTRSFDDDEMVETAKRISNYFLLFGANVQVNMNTPGWHEQQKSEFINLVSLTFKDILGFEPRLVVMHFVLEAGYFVQKYPGIQIACIGPRIIEPHSVNERVELSTIDNIYSVLIELLRRLTI